MTRVCLQFVIVVFPDLARRGDTGMLQFVNVAFPDLARHDDTGLSPVCECDISRLSQTR